MPAGIGVRRYERQDGTVTETYTVRWKEPDGTKRRRSFDSVDDALDFQAKRRSAKRWRPSEIRQEEAGRRTLGEFFAQWWVDHAMVELKRSTLATYRCVWEAHAEPRLAIVPIGEIDARKVVAFRGDLLAAGVGPQSVVKTMALLQRVFRDAVEYGEVAFNPFKAVRKPSPGPGREARPFTPLQVEQLAADIDARGYGLSAVLVRLMAYTALRPQEALALHWYAVGARTLLVEHVNADGELEPLKNRKRARKRSRTVELMRPHERTSPSGDARDTAQAMRRLSFRMRCTAACGSTSTTAHGAAGSTSRRPRTSACRVVVPTTCGTRGRHC